MLLAFLSVQLGIGASISLQANVVSLPTDPQFRQENVSRREEAEGLEDYVQMLAGTSTPYKSAPSDGNTLPQLKRPWGFNDWVPQVRDATETRMWFLRNSMQFYGMRCTHQPSPWLRDYSWFTVLPRQYPHEDLLDYDPEETTFKPHYFRSELWGSAGRMVMEFSPTNHAGFFRVQFSEDRGREIVLSAPESVMWAENDAIFGHTRDMFSDDGEAFRTPGGWKMYFVMKPLGHHHTSGVVVNGSSLWGAQSQHATLKFADDAEGPFEVAVATSFISVEQAELNLALEVGQKSFHEVLEEAQSAWRSVLSVFEVEMQDLASKYVFYTNLWKAVLFPRFLTEMDASNNEVHRNPCTGAVASGALVADSGFWDAYRTVYPLNSLAFPDNFGKMISAHVNAHRHCGWVPQWPSPGPRRSMGGTLGDVAIADGIIKHSLGLVHGFDPEEAYAAIRKNAFNTSSNAFFGRPRLQQYIDDGFLVEAEFRDERDQTGVSESVTRSLEHMLCDAAIANAAASLGRVDDERELRRRSRRYTNLFNPDRMAFQPRSGNGSFLEPFELGAWRWGFTEGSGWHYRFFVPYDVDGLKLLYAGELCTHLENMFLDEEDPASNPGGYWTVIHEMNEAAQLSRKAFGQYAHNNQPVHHILWVAKKAGCDKVADHFLRRTVRELYTMQTFAGDEDNGEMAAWYILSAVGLYQLEGSVNELLVGSPSLISATIHFQGGDLQITTENQGENNRFVQAATWAPRGGRQRLILDSVLRFDEILQGGHLHIVLGASPAESLPASVLV